VKYRKKTEKDNKKVCSPYININPKTIFKIVNQNQYPLGVLSWRYFAQICESMSVAIVDQIRCHSEKFMKVSIE
jgi:hypothetical protein